ncbi:MULTISPECIES: potassium-transporting ATPase subunit F [Culturomica]
MFGYLLYVLIKPEEF